MSPQPYQMERFLSRVALKQNFRLIAIVKNPTPCHCTTGFNEVDGYTN